MIPSQHLNVFETFSSFKTNLRKHLILRCSDEIFKFLCNCIFKIKEVQIELKNVNSNTLKTNKHLITKFCLTRIRLSLRRKILGSQQGTSLLCLKLKGYEQQSSQEECTCSRRLINRSRATVHNRQTAVR